MKTYRHICIIFLVLFLVISFSSVNAATNKNGTVAAQFLKIGAGARAMGMAGAVVAIPEDPYALYWNPAIITTIHRPTLSGSHTQWFADIRHEFFSFILPVNNSSAVGFQVIILTMDDMEITTVDQPHGTGEFFGASDLAIGASYGIRVTDFFALGFTGKYIQQSIYNENAGTFALDIGSILNVPFYGLRLGMNFSNFGGKLQLDGRDLTREFDLNPNNTLNVGVESRLKTEPWELPVNFRVGVSMDMVGDQQNFFNSEMNRFTLSIDGNHPTDGDEFLAFGAEYAFRDILMLRGGYRLNRDVEKLFYGIGLNVPMTGAGFTFDYALASFDELDYIHIFSGSISF
ncbi:MAG: PorV/PorQ family protein [Calditrichaeota bacterium]|nr:PorV/PorQ family protein [Calditrichota bacterium]RQW06616.1 MAG: PorV/PorQ family protein [Calditrichota bacterium]